MNTDFETSPAGPVIPMPRTGRPAGMMPMPGGACGQMPMPGSLCGQMPMPGGSCGQMPGVMPLAMGYVPMQRWGQTYPIGQGMSRGTIFPELDQPFVMGRCR